MSATRFSGQTAVIVGASSGMGREVARLVAEQGARVHLVARSLEALKTVAGEIGPAATFAHADMTDADAMRQAVVSIGRIDHLLMSAISGELARKDPIAEITEFQLERSFDRIRGYVRAVQAVLPAFSRDGSMTFWCGASAVRPPSCGLCAKLIRGAS